MSFKYERLPNLCYWCGQLSHDDKDCTLWLQSKGMLAVEDRQFGPWIRATQFNQSKKSVVEVQGYDPSMHKIQNPTSGSLQNTNSQRVYTMIGKAVSQLLVEGPVVGQGRAKEAPTIGSHSSEHTVLDFEEIIQDIDESINAYSNNSSLNLDLDKRFEDNEERMLLDVPVLVANLTQTDSEWRKDKMGSVTHCEVVSGCEFQVGWTSGEKGKVGGRVGSNKRGERKCRKTK